MIRGTHTISGIAAQRKNIYVLWNPVRVRISTVRAGIAFRAPQPRPTRRLVKMPVKPGWIDKISAMAAMIFPTAAKCDVNRDRMGRIELILMPAAEIEMRVLNG